MAGHPPSGLRAVVRLLRPRDERFHRAGGRGRRKVEGRRPGEACQRGGHAVLHRASPDQLRRGRRALWRFAHGRGRRVDRLARGVCGVRRTGADRAGRRLAGTAPVVVARRRFPGEGGDEGHRPFLRHADRPETPRSPAQARRTRRHPSGRAAPRDGAGRQRCAERAGRLQARKSRQPWREGAAAVPGHRRRQGPEAVLPGQRSVGARPRDREPGESAHSPGVREPGLAPPSRRAARPHPE